MSLSSLSLPVLLLRLEDALTSLAAPLLERLAASKKLNAHALALCVTGLTHDHDPTDHLVPGCAYCARCGNIFAPMAETEAARAMPTAADVVNKYQVPIVGLMVDFADEILDIVAASKKIDVEDIRDSVLGQMRAYSDKDKENVDPNTAAGTGGGGEDPKQ
jgi:hypothetical protein